MYITLAWEDPATGTIEERAITPPLVIGRSTESGLTLGSTEVSSEHAQLAYAPSGDLTLTDLDSTNGTLLNGEPITAPTPLETGDIITVGPFTLTLTIKQADDPEDTPSLIVRWQGAEVETRSEVIIQPPFTIGRSGQNDIRLDSSQVSRTHARVELQAEQILLSDADSGNGTFVNRDRIEQAFVQPGDEVRIGPYTFSFERADVSTQLMEVVEVRGRTATVSIDLSDFSELLGGQATERLPGQAFPPHAFSREVVDLDEVRAEDYEVEETTYLTIGGGLGSFTFVDRLLIYGADPTQIVSIGFDEKPYGRYERLCINSQIPAHERLRSDAGSTPDNIWGFPSYATREIWQDVTSGRFGHAIKIMWHMFGEPTLVATYTPISGEVFKSIEREARRIGWADMHRQGKVRAIRKTTDGRYVVAYSDAGNEDRQRHIIAAPYVHVAVGYPALRFLPDLQAYREETGDFEHVVNAYEEHAHVYDDLQRNGGTVLIRGRGIVASRILQRLYETRQLNSNIQILHLMRSRNEQGQKYGLARRFVEHHWEYQPFNWPKAAWGGDLRNRLERASDEERAELLSDWGGTTTADRPDWRRIIDGGQREGWYVIRFGTVKQVERVDGRLNTTVQAKSSIGEMMTLTADYIIDSTGLISSIDDSPLLHDLLSHHGLPRNAVGRLKVSNDFEIEGMRNEGGRMYASGVATLGGPYAAVDSFLGLQYAAYRITDDLARANAPGVRYLRGFRSMGQWFKWVRGAQP